MVICRWDSKASTFDEERHSTHSTCSWLYSGARRQNSLASKRSRGCSTSNDLGRGKVNRRVCARAERLCDARGSGLSSETERLGGLESGKSAVHFSIAKLRDKQIWKSREIESKNIPEVSIMKNWLKKNLVWSFSGFLREKKTGRRL